MERLATLSLGKLTALCTLVAVGIVAVTSGQQMFSSGPLNTQNRRSLERGGVKSHAEIASNCAACHVAPWSSQTMADRCMDCHTDIRVVLDKKLPMHGMLAHGQRCLTCHTEHKGPHAALTDFKHFHHDYAAFKLTGKHIPLDCKSCHKNELYQGTPTSCVSCHAEPKVHQGRFGLDCKSCHSTNNWAASMFAAKSFDHSQTRFPLTGKHVAVDCKSCHKTETFQGTPTTCIACHKQNEPASHKNKFGNNCTLCHTTSTWHGHTFAHKFPVDHRGAGKRKESCNLCHPNHNADNFVSYTCYGCHEHTPAKEAARHARRKMSATVKLENCATCHPTGRGAKRIAAADAPAFDVCMACPMGDDDLLVASFARLGNGKREMPPVVPADSDVSSRIRFIYSTTHIQNETNGVE